MMRTSFEALFLCLRGKGVYAIEDTHTMTIWKNKESADRDIYKFVGDIGRRMVGYWPKDAKPDPFVSHLAVWLKYLMI